MTVTDETVWTADAAYNACAITHDRVPRLCCMRAAILAAAPLIAAQALAEVDEKTGDVPYIDRGGVPYVEREHMFDVVNRAGRALLGDDYSPLILAEIERRRNTP